MPTMHDQHDSVPAPVAIHSRGLYELPARDATAAVWVPLDKLIDADSPRLQGLDAQHAEALAQIDGEMPPILVHRPTMRVIDGMHRLGAARMRGQDEICVQFLNCAEDDVFLLAVAANIRHGLPLTLQDRRAAAARIVAQRPDASDRWIAELAGLAAKTVASIRRNETDSVLLPARRVGRDGRVRPIDASEGRRLAQEILASNPDASLRRIAHGAGISVGTARDVREKVRKGIDPILPMRRQLNGNGTEPKSAEEKKSPSEVDINSVTRRLCHDPSVRYTESGRSLLQWLHSPRIMQNSDWQNIVDSIPPHCTYHMIKIAHNCALAWEAFADELNRRNSDLVSR